MFLKSLMIPGIVVFALGNCVKIKSSKTLAKGDSKQLSLFQSAEPFSVASQVFEL